MLASAPRARLTGRMSSSPAQFSGVTVLSKANVYFDGNVVSHTVLFADGSKKTLGLIRPGSYHFNTGAPERMEIVAGSCQVTLDGATGTHSAPVRVFGEQLWNYYVRSYPNVVAAHYPELSRTPAQP